jgi:uncharacterized protein (DUF433 family)
VEVFPGVSMDGEVGPGRPCIAGTKVEVAAVLAALAASPSLASACASSAVDAEQARAALAYAAHLAAHVPPIVLRTPVVAARAGAESARRTEGGGTYEHGATPGAKRERTRAARRERGEVAAESTRERFHEQRSRTRLIAAYSDRSKRRITVVYGPAAKSGAVYDASADHLRTRRFWVGRMSVLVNGVALSEFEAELDDWMLDVLAETAKEWEQEQIDADELVDVIPDFLESIERQAEESTDADEKEDVLF